MTVNLSRGSVHDEPATRRGSVVRSRDERSEVGAVRSQMYAVLLASPITPSAAIELEAKFADGSIVMATPPFAGLAAAGTCPIRLGLYCSQNVLSPAASLVAGIRTAVIPRSVRSARTSVYVLLTPVHIAVLVAGRNDAATRNVGEKNEVRLLEPITSALLPYSTSAHVVRYVSGTPALHEFACGRPRLWPSSCAHTPAYPGAAYVHEVGPPTSPRPANPQSFVSEVNVTIRLSVLFSSPRSSMCLRA